MIAPLLAAALVCFSPIVTDGDTIKDCAGQHVRLYGVDSPEKDGSPRCRHPSRDGAWACDREAMAYAIPARDRLVELTKGRSVVCEVKDTDRYRRSVAVCFADGVDVGRALVREGLAVDYSRYSRGAYLNDETRARREHRGMWEAGR